APAALLEHLQSLDSEILGHFRGDDQGWFAAELSISDAGVVTLERFLSTEEDIRAELNTWAAWVEANATDATRLMQHLIATKQVFTVQVEDEDADEAIFVSLCRHLARLTDGVYQIDGQGFFDVEGRLLVREES